MAQSCLTTSECTAVGTWPHQTEPAREAETYLLEPMERGQAQGWQSPGVPYKGVP